MCTYLHRRGAIYCFRRIVPVELRPFILTARGKPRQEWNISLKTPDRETAKLAIPLHVMRTNRELSRAKKALAAGELPESLPARNADPDANMSREEWEAREEAARWLAEQDAAQEALEMLPEERQTERLLPDITEIEAAMQMPALALDDRMAVMRLVIQRHDEANRNKEWQEAARQFVESEEAAAKLAQGGAKPEPVKSAAMPLLDLFEAYVAERRTLAPSTVTGWRGYMRNLIVFLGHDDAGKVTPDDVIGWKDRLLVTRKRNGEPLSKRTIEDGYLAAARAIFSWAAKNRKIGANPAADVGIRLTHADKAEKRDYTDAEARAVLAASLLPYEGRAAETSKLARRWVPWLCAYTGARVGEIGQLRGQDVQEIEGVWCLHITPEAGAVKTKRARIVPIHSHLIEMGFLAVAEAAGDAPIFYDPSRQRLAEANGLQHKKVGERLAKWVREDVGITDPAVDPSHGWRHRFKSEAREEDIDREARDRLQGHAASTEGEKYGGWRVKALQREIEKLPRYSV